MKRLLQMLHYMFLTPIYLRCRCWRHFSLAFDSVALLLLRCRAVNNWAGINCKGTLNVDEAVADAKMMFSATVFYFRCWRHFSLTFDSMAPTSAALAEKLMASDINYCKRP